MTDDGVALTSIAHPRAPLWRRVWSWLRPARLSEDALETIEVEVPNRFPLEPGPDCTKFVYRFRTNVDPLVFEVANEKVTRVTVLSDTVMIFVERESAAA